MSEYNFDKVIPRQHTDSVKWRMADNIFRKTDVIPMWVADMDFPIAQEISTAIRKRADHEIYGYPVPGPEIFNAVVNRMEKNYGWKIEPEWIIFTPGIVPALYASVKAFARPGDDVVIQSPVYRPFWSAVKDNGCQVLNNQLKLIDGQYRIDFKNLNNLFQSGARPGLVSMPSRARMMILCSPHNPVGRVWSKEELIGVGEIILKNRAVLVSDEIHAEILINGSTHIPFASLSPEFEQFSITCLSPSKAFNLAGLGASAIIIPNPVLRQQFNGAKTGVMPMVNSFGLVALEAAYNSGDKWLNACLRYLQGNFDFLRDFFTKRISDIKVIQPEGTYLVWLDCRELGLNDPDLRRLMREKARLGLEDGFTFGPGGEGFQRMNIACPRSILHQALERLESAVNKL